jgi:asparagine N-glycosylation enzyme membrane subunit Stt3
LAIVGSPLKAATEPESELWYFADTIQWAGLFAPFCLVVLLFCFIVIPPKGPVAKLLALILSILTAYLAWQAVMFAAYYLGFSSFPNI